MTDARTPPPVWLGSFEATPAAVVRTGALLGVLTGFVALVVALAGQVLCIMLLWNALQNQQLQSRLAWDYQGWLQSPGVTPTLWSFLHFEWAGEGIELFLFVLFLLLVLQEIMATIGGVLGAWASRRASVAAGQEALSELPVDQAMVFRMALTIVSLDLLTWARYDLVNDTGGGPFSPTHLITSFTSPAFAAWLLAALAIVVAVLVTARSAPCSEWGTPPRSVSDPREVCGVKGVTMQQTGDGRADGGASVSTRAR